MYYTYIIRSISYPDELYIGATENLKHRLADHNAKHCRHTSKFAPWRLECYVAFREKFQAYVFEKYLKTHSGRAFARKRLYMIGGPIDEDGSNG